jgi:hypothetical protein
MFSVSCEQAEEDIFVIETECVVCENWAEAEETVTHRAFSMIDCKLRVSTLKELSIVNLPAYEISIVNLLLRDREIL